MCKVEHSLGRGGGGCHQHLIPGVTLGPSLFLLALQGLQGPLQRQQEGWAGTPWWRWRVAPHPTPGSFSGICPPTGLSPFTAIVSWTWGGRRGLRGHFVLQRRKLSLSEIILLGTGTPSSLSLTPMFLSFCICELGIPAPPSPLPQAFRARSGWAGSRSLREGTV